MATPNDDIAQIAEYLRGQGIMVDETIESTLRQMRTEHPDLLSDDLPLKFETMLSYFIQGESLSLLSNTIRRLDAMCTAEQGMTEEQRSTSRSAAAESMPQGYALPMILDTFHMMKSPDLATLSESASKWKNIVKFSKELKRIRNETKMQTHNKTMQRMRLYDILTSKTFLPNFQTRHQKNHQKYFTETQTVRVSKSSL